MSVEWRDTLGYESLYQVSIEGEVCRLRPDGSRRILAQCRADRGGHLCVTLCKAGKPRRVYVHVLVATAFLGPKPGPGYEVRHLDDVPSHNHASNLAWGTRGENLRDRIKLGTWTPPRRSGESHGRAKLTSEAVAAIRAAKGQDAREVAREHGVHWATVYRIWRGEIWGERVA